MGCSQPMLKAMRWTEGPDTTLRYSNPAGQRNGYLPIHDLENTSRSEMQHRLEDGRHCHYPDTSQGTDARDRRKLQLCSHCRTDVRHR